MCVCVCVLNFDQPTNQLDVVCISIVMNLILVNICTLCTCDVCLYCTVHWNAWKSTFSENYLRCAWWVVLVERVTVLFVVYVCVVQLMQLKTVISQLYLVFDLRLSNFVRNVMCFVTRYTVALVNGWPTLSFYWEHTQSHFVQVAFFPYKRTFPGNLRWYFTSLLRFLTNSVKALTPLKKLPTDCPFLIHWW